MAAALLTGLKIIGIILAFVAALVLLVLVLALFVPVRYRIICNKCEQENEIFCKAGVTYLLHIVSAGIKYDNDLEKYVRIFGIKTGRKKSKKKDIAPEPDNVIEDDGKDYDGKEDDGKDDYVKEDYTIDWNDTGEDTGTDTGTDTESFSDKFDKIAALAEKYGQYSAKINKIRKDIRFWDKMVHDEKNQNAVCLVKYKTVKLLKKIAPKRVKGFVHFGFEDPATTGRILAYLAIVYPVMPKKLKIEPSFTDTDLFGNIDIKGHIALISVAIPLLTVYFNRDCRRAWRLYKRHKNK